MTDAEMGRLCFCPEGMVPQRSQAVTSLYKDVVNCPRKRQDGLNLPKGGEAKVGTALYEGKAEQQKMEDWKIERAKTYI